MQLHAVLLHIEMAVKANKMEMVMSSIQKGLDDTLFAVKQAKYIPMMLIEK